jgi:hypothetical protein
MRVHDRSAALDGVGVGAGVTALDLVVETARGGELVATVEVGAGAAAPGVAVLHPPSTAAEAMAIMPAGQRITVTLMVVVPSTDCRAATRGTGRLQGQPHAVNRPGSKVSMRTSSARPLPPVG